MQELLEKVLDIYVQSANAMPTAEERRNGLPNMASQLLGSGNLFTRAEAVEFFNHVAGTIITRTDPVKNGQTTCYYITIDSIDYDLMLSSNHSSIRIMRGPDTLPSFMRLHNGELHFSYSEHHEVTYRANGECEFQIGSICGEFGGNAQRYLHVWFDATEFYEEATEVEMKIMDCGHFEVHFYEPVAEGECILLDSPLSGSMGAGI